jgi:predicted nucleic acid-binding Zn ribbon protein
MPDFKFNCPHCDQSLEAPEELLGQQISCPTCKKIFNVTRQPSIEAAPIRAQKIAQIDVTEDRRACPYCGEPILPSAQKCKHCGEFLKGDHEVKTNVKQGALVGAIACFIIGIVMMFLSLWTFIMYAPLFLAAFVLSIVAMAQKRVTGGIAMMLLTVIMPPIVFFGLIAVRGKKALESASKSLAQASTGIENSVAIKPPNSPEPANPLVDAKREKQEYIQLIDLYDFQARHYESVLEGKVPGVEFKLRNRGNRSLKTVKVTVYFQDANGNTISDQSYYPVNTSSWMEPGKALKPNYVWQIERGKFYTAKNVPDEWMEGKATAKITDIEFEE